MAIAANKVAGMRAAAGRRRGHRARSSREHNDANVLALGERAHAADAARAASSTSFLDTPFAGGRHQRRVDKITRSIDD